MLVSLQRMKKNIHLFSPNLLSYQWTQPLFDYDLGSVHNFLPFNQWWSFTIGYGQVLCWVEGTDVREQTLRQGLCGSQVRDDTDADRELPNHVVRSITEMGKESYGHRRWPTLSRDIVDVLIEGNTWAPSQRTRGDHWGAGGRCCRDRTQCVPGVGAAWKESWPTLQQSG